MKVLVVGSGGREHTLVREIAKSSKCTEVIAAPGNPGMQGLARLVNVGAEDVPGLVALAQKENVDLVVVGPEVALVLGLADELRALNIDVFGPSKLAARLEGSKAFSKDIMAKYDVPTAKYQNFTDKNEALAYLQSEGAPIVVKASGLAAGKGAIVCMTMDEAVSAVEDMLGDAAIFGESGAEVVIEEFMTGEEASIFALCDGADYVTLSPAQDHKRIFDGDQGPNTGGMGAYAPAGIVTDELLAEIKKTIIEPTLNGMIQEGCPYHGVLYVGIMTTPEGPKVVEYNCRFGDPECQIVLPLYKGDVLELLNACATGKISSIQIEENEGSSAIVVLASGGYPGSYAKGKEISGINDMPTNVHIIHAGTQVQEGKLLTSGGRVLGVVGQGAELKESLDLCYECVDKINFEDMYFRKDIGQKGLKRCSN